METTATFVDKALENMIRKDGVRLSPVYVGPYFCQEIDYCKDLEYVRNHLNGI